MLELLPVGASKGKGAALMMRDCGIDPSTAMAIGDGDNDVEMIEAVRFGVAMNNATEALKRSAKFVLTKGNDSDGVAEAFDNFVFISTDRK